MYRTDKQAAQYTNLLFTNQEGFCLFFRNSLGVQLPTDLRGGVAHLATARRVW